MGRKLKPALGRAPHLRLFSVLRPPRRILSKTEFKTAQILCPAFHSLGYWIIALSIIFLLFPVIADAAYKIYLKNGSVIKGVSHYEKSMEEIRFYFEGGMIGIPESDVLKIENTMEQIMDMKATEKPSEERARPAEIKESTEEISALKAHADASEKRLRAISQKESELKKEEEDRQRTMVRIQNLYLKSARGTITPGEKSMLKQNMIIKRKLDSDKQKLETELKKLREEQDHEQTE
ncbi:MAG: hypothetical protein HY755_10980 [Nitrospirae bacterium]|nr:hypothetical protein [Nitrospirota bacterium]